LLIIKERGRTLEMYEYQINTIARNMFKAICPKAYRRCSSDKEVNYKILRLYDLGKKVLLPEYGNECTVSCYYDLLLILNNETNTIEGILKDQRYYTAIKHDLEEDYESKYIEYWNDKNKTTSKVDSFLVKMNTIFKYLLNFNKYHASFDGSYREYENVMGIGYEIKKGNRIIHRFSQITDIAEYEDRNTISYDAEILSLKLLLDKIEELGIRRINITGDHLGLIECINSNKDKDKLKEINHIIRSSRSSGNKIRLRWVSRKYNQTAHSLANGLM
jgi:ribonuclease HI